MIYSGLGILAVLIYLLVFFAFWFACGFLTGDAKFLSNSIFAMLLAFLTAGAAVWFFGRWLNKLNPLELDEIYEGKRLKVTKARHTIYTLEMEYWGIIFFVLSAVILIVKKLQFL
jgi:hypothetical protein